MLQYLSDMDYLNMSKIGAELNLRGYFAATTPLVTTPVTTPAHTNLQILGWCIDLALGSGAIHLPTTNINSPAKYLEPAVWAQISLLAIQVAPQLNSQYGTNLVITQALIDNQLHIRNYWKASVTTPSVITPSVTTPSVTLPSISLKAYTEKVVDYALSHYGKTLHPTTTAYLTSAEWSNIVNYAYNYDQSIDQNYTILSGLSGLGYLGAGEGCYDTFGMPVACPTYGQSWGSQWGPIIMQILGSALTIAGNYWQASQLRNQASSLYQQTSGVPFGIGTTRDAELMARQLMVQHPGMTYKQAYEQACGALGLPYPDKTEFPSWLLPVAIALGMYLIIGKR